MKPSGKGGTALTADRGVPDPDLCGPHCFQMPGEGDQTGKDWPCHTLSLPQFQVDGGTLYQLPSTGVLCPPTSAPRQAPVSPLQG